MHTQKLSVSQWHATSHASLFLSQCRTTETNMIFGLLRLIMDKRRIIHNISQYTILLNKTSFFKNYASNMFDFAALGLNI